MIKKITCLLIIFSILIACSPPVLAAKQPVFSLPTNPRPLQKTPVSLTEYSVVLHWYEDRTDVTGTYHLVNPAARKVKLTMCIPVKPVMVRSPLSTENEPAIKAAVSGEEIEIRYSKTSKMYLWDLSFNANEELDLTLDYSLANSVADEGFVTTGFNYIPAGLWSGEPGKGAITLEFSGIHPGQVTNISPFPYKFTGNLLDLKQGTATASENISGTIENIIITADIASEKLQWLEKLSDNEKFLLEQYVTVRQYAKVAYLFEEYWEKAAREDKEPLRIAQAYYLEKAGYIDEAGVIWKELFDRAAKSSRVYWALAREYNGQANRLTKLYSQAKELQIHPLLQSWLAVQIPAGKIKPSPPEISEPDFIEGNKGLTFNCSATDPDGDLDKIALRYHWEEEPELEYAFELEPFKYLYETELAIPAKKPLQRLFYEVIAVDRTGSSVTTGLKETFYLNSEIPVEIFPLSGATMIAGDFAPEEQARVHNWFKSYLKMAREVDFVPIEAKTPYFIFIGKPHDFIEQYKGPLFLHYTPAPFASEKTKIPVHRYFLSYWYGPGWNNLSENELVKLGDGLLLGRGFYALSLKYLKAKDPEQFDTVLAAVGQGKAWDETVREIYRMNPDEILLNSLWHSFGNNVLAVIIIIIVAWLGKTGHLVRFLNYLRSGRAR